MFSKYAFSIFSDTYLGYPHKLSQIFKNFLPRKIYKSVFTTVNLRRITFKYYVEIKVVPKAEIHELGSQI